ncbi:MAG: GIY-YIG nuclease family protein, partial [Syntrophomonadaceae bacterium]|nr:GIY-YIG nuclease family protein [Syntrophomonadaceae bacterium]
IGKSTCWARDSSVGAFYSERKSVMNISKEKKKELQAQYKLMKSDMGIFAVINKSNAKYFLETTPDLKGRINSTKFKLNAGGHSNKELQKDWQELGENAFEIKILEQIEYEEDESKTDYLEDLELLKMIWLEKLSKGMAQFY